jgi:hypothetical protein
LTYVRWPRRTRWLPWIAGHVARLEEILADLSP